MYLVSNDNRYTKNIEFDILQIFQLLNKSYYKAPIVDTKI